MIRPFASALALLLAAPAFAQAFDAAKLREAALKDDTAFNIWKG